MNFSSRYFSVRSLAALLFISAGTLVGQTSVNSSTTSGTVVPGPDPEAHPTLQPSDPAHPPPDVSSTTVQTPEADAWQILSGYTYEQRDELITKLVSISKRFDEEIAELNAKRAKMQSDTSDWDQAMKEVVNARADFKFKADTVGRANTPDTYNDAKGKVGDAFDRLRAAVTGVRNSRTN